MSMYSDEARRAIADETTKHNQERMKSDAKFERYGMKYFNLRDAGFTHESACRACKVDDNDDGVLSRDEYEEEVMRGNDDDTAASTADEFRGGDQTHLADLVADRLIESGEFKSRRDAMYFVLHTPKGMQLLRLLSMHKGASEMDTVEKLERARAAHLRKLGKDAIAICKAIVDDGDALGLSEHDFTAIATAKARELYPADRPDVAFSKLFSANDENGEILRKAHRVVRNSQTEGLLHPFPA
jgi:hypothetical protein